MAAIFENAYPSAGPYDEACNIPKLAKQVNWARRAYADQQESSSEESSEEEEERTCYLDDEKVWDAKEFENVSKQVAAVESLVKDLKARGDRLESNLREHHDQVRTVNVLFNDMKRNVEAILVQLDTKKRSRIMQAS